MKKTKGKKLGYIFYSISFIFVFIPILALVIHAICKKL